MMLAEKQPLTMIGRRYVLQAHLGAGAMGTVDSALDRLTGQRVALKRVTTPTGQLQFASLSSGSMNTRLALAREFRTLASLRHPNIISVLDYGFIDQEQPFFTMELLEGAQTIVAAAENKPFEVKVDLLVQMLQALAYLHRRDILHRDLKPGNVLVVGGELKVLDFGLSAVHEDTSALMAGTLAYMAPEVIQEKPANRASDLYSVGIIAYQLFAGHHPFNTRDNIRLLNDALTVMPDITALDVPGDIAAVVGRLLAKSPDDRYQSAAEVIRVLSQATDRRMTMETAAVRDSFLQAAEFVGRDAELAQLTEALASAKDGHGSAWLIGGESGVGKSRLLDELRVRALVQGALVLRGQAVSEGGSPYHLWRPIVRWLSLLADLSDFEAGVLSSLVPDMAALLGRPVRETSDLDSQVAQKRLLNVLEDLFRRVGQSGGPELVLILEDLQWSGESLDVLARLNAMVGKLPLLILGSYRDDERPELPESLPQMRLLKLERLDESAIGELSAAMLGDNGRQTEVISLLQRETEGNVFFLVEVVRALAEEAGRLEDVGTRTLPARVFAGGMQVLVRRRLERVPERARPFLQLAAVAGRQLDLGVLRAAFTSPPVPLSIHGEGETLPSSMYGGRAGDGGLDKWLLDCANAAVLEVHEDQWRFAHDKLREGLLVDLPDEERRGLHRRLAEAMEAVYRDAPQQASALAYHWKMAGDTRKEGHYAAQAGEYALQSGAFRDAVDFLERAAAIYQDDFGQKFRRARWERQLGEAYIGLGNMNASRVRLLRGVALLGRPWPKTPQQLRLAFAGELARQAAHRIAPGIFQGRLKSKAEVLLESARAYERINQIDYYANRIVDGLYGAVLGLNVSEAAGVSPELVRFFATACVACGTIPLHRLAEMYARRSLAMSEQVNDLSARSWALQATSLYRMGVARWKDVHGSLEKAIEISTQLGDFRRLGEMGVLSTWAVYAQGEFERAADRFADAYQLGKRSGDVQVQAWAFQGQAMSILRLGQFDEAIELVKDTKAPWVLALAYLRRGHLTLAREQVEAATKRTRWRPTQVYLFDPYVIPTEVRMGLWEANPGDASLREVAGKACRATQRYAAIFSVGQPRAWLWQGVYEWLSGQPQKATQLWQKSLALAQRIDMPFDQALAHYEIGRHLDANDPMRREHLTRAAELFERVGAWYNARLAKDAQEKR